MFQNLGRVDGMHGMAVSVCQLACLYVIQVYGPALPVESTARVPYSGLCKPALRVSTLRAHCTVSSPAGCSSLRTSGKRSMALSKLSCSVPILSSCVKRAMSL